MKRNCAVLLALLVLLSSLFCGTAAAAQPEFDIQDGVLVKYNGAASSVTLPASVTAVGDSAFLNNTALQTLNLGANVYAIGDKAFFGCASLQTVTGGDNVGEVGNLAFRYTPYLEQSTVKYLILGKVLLWYNGTSQSVSIPTRCTSVASYAFMRCEYLKAFNAYEGLLTIGPGAFYGCSALETVNLPSTVSDIGAYAFDGTPYLRNAGEFAIAGDGVLLRYQGSDTDVVVPEAVRRISPYAFISSKINSVTLPESVTVIDPYAFADCVGMTQINFGGSLVSIGDAAFRGCKSLRTITTPASLSYIGQGAFNGASGLDGAVLYGSELTVSYNAFRNCTGLRYVLMTDGVVAVYDNAFDSCTALEGVAMSSFAADLSASALSGCGKAVVCCEKNSTAERVFADQAVNTVMGDSDSDGDLSIMDASLIQYYVAGLGSLNGTQTASSDVNFDGEITVFDAFLVQLKVAGLG